MLHLLLVSLFTFVELNCENLFDCRHDSLKEDTEYLPDSYRHWNNYRYWNKLNHIGQEILACGGDSAHWELPDMVALCEVENDSVMHDLTRRSLLRQAGYEYVMTSSPDVRGIDVALLYSPFSFQLIHSYALRVNPLKGMRPTRDILYASGRIASGDTLHVFVVHAPSRMGGKRLTKPHRMAVCSRLKQSIDSLRLLSPHARVIVAGDFNDSHDDASLRYLATQGLEDVSHHAVGSHGAQGSYRYRGEWESIDHILCSHSAASRMVSCYVGDMPFLLEDDDRYGGKKPLRTFYGARYLNGFSDHLPLIVTFDW